MSLPSPPLRATNTAVQTAGMCVPAVRHGPWLFPAELSSRRVPNPLSQQAPRGIGDVGKGKFQPQTVREDIMPIGGNSWATEGKFLIAGKKGKD